MVVECDDSQKILPGEKRDGQERADVCTAQVSLAVDWRTGFDITDEYRFLSLAAITIADASASEYCSPLMSSGRPKCAF